MRAAAFALVVLLAACAPSETRPPELLPQTVAPAGVEFRLYRAPELPPHLRTSGGSGYSVVAVTVGPDGRVTDAVGLEASDQACIDAVLDVVPTWVFAPVADPPTEPRREVLHYGFRSNGVVNVLSGPEAAIPGNVGSSAAIRTLRWSDMNPPPERLPPEIGDSPPARIRGTAEINFIIDETGRVRVPAIVEASDWDAALVALDDVADWRFAPPKHGGQSVLVEVRARWGN